MNAPACFTCSCAECQARTRRWLGWMIVLGLVFGAATGVWITLRFFPSP